MALQCRVVVVVVLVVVLLVVEEREREMRGRGRGRGRRGAGGRERRGERIGIMKERLFQIEFGMSCRQQLCVATQTTDRHAWPR